MSKHSTPANGRPRTRTIVAASFGVGALALTGAGVYAGLTAQATNTTAETVTSGTLSLVMSNEASAVNLSNSVSNMAPGDTNSRFVVLTNGATLAATSLGLKVTGTGANALTNDATKGLSVTVTDCSIAWVPAAGTCAGTATTYLTSTPIASLGSTVAFTNGGSGAIDPATSAVYHLKVTLTLNGTENTLNGVPVPGSGTTIQGQSTDLTYTFSENQRAAVPTNA